MITTLDIFSKEPLRLPNVEAAPNGADNTLEIQGYIDMYERELLINCLGITLYNDVKEALGDLENATQAIKELVNGVDYDLNGRTVRWNGLKEYSFLPYYIYWKYLQKKVDIFTTMGVERPEAVNSQSTSSIMRATEVYREFLQKYQSGDHLPTILYRRVGVGIDYSGTVTTDRSLYQYMVDNDLDVTFFKFYEDINSLGI